jgi:hypothetical protein
VIVFSNPMNLDPIDISRHLNPTLAGRPSWIRHRQALTMIFYGDRSAFCVCAGLRRSALSSRHKGVTSPISRLFLLRSPRVFYVLRPASDAAFVMVPGGGVEPPRPEGRRILSPLRLPIPPSRPGWLIYRLFHDDEFVTWALRQPHSLALSITGDLMILAVPPLSVEAAIPNSLRPGVSTPTHSKVLQSLRELRLLLWLRPKRIDAGSVAAFQPEQTRTRSRE